MEFKNSRQLINQYQAWLRNSDVEHETNSSCQCYSNRCLNTVRNCLVLFPSLICTPSTREQCRLSQYIKFVNIMFLWRNDFFFEIQYIIFYLCFGHSTHSICSSINRTGEVEKFREFAELYCNWMVWPFLWDQKFQERQFSKVMCWSYIVNSLCCIFYCAFRSCEINLLKEGQQSKTSWHIVSNKLPAIHSDQKWNPND